MNQETPLNNQERRKHPRTKVSSVIRVLERDQEVQLGQLVDLSLDGMMLLANDAVQANRVFRMRLEFPDGFDMDPIQFGAESMWVEDSHDVNSHWAGFQIIDISPENADKIRRLIDDYL
jgi:c-di-GMP-binding flagellar brake protein YcgR